MVAPSVFGLDLGVKPGQVEHGTGCSVLVRAESVGFLHEV